MTAHIPTGVIGSVRGSFTYAVGVAQRCWGRTTKRVSALVPSMFEQHQQPQSTCNQEQLVYKEA